MQARQQGWTAMMAVGLVAVGLTAAAQPLTDSGTPEFSADVVVETSIVDANGVVVETRPKTQYRMNVRIVDGERQTEIVYAANKLFPRGPLVDPRGGYRLVFGAGRHGVTIYDPTGALVSSTDGGADIGEASAPAGPTFADADRSVRKDDLVRRLGRAVGKVGRRDRYVTKEHDTTVETLVEPDSNLPAEINVVRNGVLEERSVFSYARMPRGRWYLATEREEASMPGQGGRRLVTRKTLVNVVSAEGR